MSAYLKDYFSRKKIWLVCWLISAFGQFGASANDVITMSTKDLDDIEGRYYSTVKRFSRGYRFVDRYYADMMSFQLVNSFEGTNNFEDPQGEHTQKINELYAKIKDDLDFKWKDIQGETNRTLAALKRRQAVQFMIEQMNERSPKIGHLYVKKPEHEFSEHVEEKGGAEINPELEIKGWQKLGYTKFAQHKRDTIPDFAIFDETSEAGKQRKHNYESGAFSWHWVIRAPVIFRENLFQGMEPLPKNLKENPESLRFSFQPTGKPHQGVPAWVRATLQNLAVMWNLSYHGAVYKSTDAFRFHVALTDFQYWCFARGEVYFQNGYAGISVSYSPFFNLFPDNGKPDGPSIPIPFAKLYVYLSYWQWFQLALNMDESALHDNMAVIKSPKGDARFLKKINILGSGPQATVWHASDGINNNLVLKFQLNPDAETDPAHLIKREHEGLMLLQLHTVSHVPKVVLFGKDQETQRKVLVTTPLGIPLLDYLEELKEGEEGSEQTKAVLRQVMKDTIVAVKSIHRAGIVHNDLHPKNVLMTLDDFRGLLIDPGLFTYIDSARTGPAHKNPDYNNLDFEYENSQSSSSSSSDKYAEDDDVWGSLAFLSVKKSLGEKTDGLDDYESLIYVWIYILSGESLPWIFLVRDFDLIWKKKVLFLENLEDNTALLLDFAKGDKELTGNLTELVDALKARPLFSTSLMTRAFTALNHLTGIDWTQSHLAFLLSLVVSLITFSLILVIFYWIAVCYAQRKPVITKTLKRDNRKKKN